MRGRWIVAFCMLLALVCLPACAENALKLWFDDNGNLFIANQSDSVLAPYGTVEVRLFGVNMEDPLLCENIGNLNLGESVMVLSGTQIQDASQNWPGVIAAAVSVSDFDEADSNVLLYQTGNEMLDDSEDEWLDMLDNASNDVAGEEADENGDLWLEDENEEENDWLDEEDNDWLDEEDMDSDEFIQSESEEINESYPYYAAVYVDSMDVYRDPECNVYWGSVPCSYIFEVLDGNGGTVTIKMLGRTGYARRKDIQPLKYGMTLYTGQLTRAYQAASLKSRYVSVGPGEYVTLHSVNNLCAEVERDGYTGYMYVDHLRVLY